MSAAIVTAVVGLSSPALAANYGSYASWRTLDCLDSNYANEVYTLACNGGAYQSWDIQSISGDLYYLKNQQTGNCLDSSATGRVYAIACNGGTNQRWNRMESGYGRWQNVETERCLQSSYNLGRQPVTTEPCAAFGSVRAQQWFKK